MAETAPQRTPEPEEAPPSLTDIATAFAAYVAIPAALFFPVGFLSRWLQIYHPYSIKIQTAWHATAVSDKLDVIGQGALILIPPLALSILLSISFGAIFLYLLKRRLNRKGLLLGCLGLLLGFLFFKPYTCALLIGAVPRNWNQLGICFSGDWGITLVSILLYFGGCALGGFLIHRDFNHGVMEAGAAPYWLGFIKGVRDHWLLNGLVVAYLLSIASALWFSWFQEEPSLSRVEYGPDGNRNVGLLLSHSADGRWYVLHSDVPGNPETFEAEGQWATNMLAIPDEDVGNVQFLRANPETVYAHKGESLQSSGIPTHYPGDVIRIELDVRDDQSGIHSASVRCHQPEESGTTLAMTRKREVENGKANWVIEKTVSNEGQKVENEVVTWADKHSVEKGGDHWAFEKTVTSKTPLGEYLCEDIKVTDGHNERTFHPSGKRFRVESDEKAPVLQDVRITVTRP
jgi:hypothetical protein